MNGPYRLAISGKMGSGKSSLAKLLVKNFDNIHQEVTYGAVYSFATKLKAISEEIFNIDPAVKDEECRRILQEVGTKMREVRSSVWVDFLLNRMDNNASLVNERITPYRFIIQVVDDLRYKNEYYALKDKGFFLIRIEADTDVRFNRLGKLHGEDHLSETELDSVSDWNFIVNDSGLYMHDLDIISGHILKTILKEDEC